MLMLPGETSKMPCSFSTATGSTGLTASTGDTVRSSKQHIFLENDVKTDMGREVFIL